MLYEEKTDKIIKAFYKVYNALGYGFLEKVYQNSMLIELEKQGFHAQSQYPIEVRYNDNVVGEYYADILVDDCIILELKVAETLHEEHEYQLINYLKATNLEVGLILNFGKKPQVKRKIFTNNNNTEDTNDTDN